MLDAGCSKLISFGIPCYNSAAYMDACIASIIRACLPPEVLDVAGAAALDDSNSSALGVVELPVPAASELDFEIIVVNDGSQKDNTAEKADAWAQRYPGVVHAIHQENGGHGAAVMQGFKNAQGMYYKPVDSDDWIDLEAGRALLARIRQLVLDEDKSIDLFINNYVYEHAVEQSSMSIDYHGVIPRGRIVSWDDIGWFRPDQNLLMHSLVYRTQVLRDCGVELPHHTFYVDNIYAYVPLPYCKTLFYEDADVYRYHIGREDQSVNEQVMTKHYKEQLLITRTMIQAYHLFDDIESSRLRSYMLGYFSLMMSASSVFSRLSDDPEAENNLQALWDFLREFDQRMYKYVRHGILGVATNLPGSMGSKLSIGLYRLARKVVKFN